MCPGRTRGGGFPTGSSEAGVRSSWSAMTVLTEAHASRQQEMDSLTHLSKRYDAFGTAVGPLM